MWRKKEKTLYYKVWGLLLLGLNVLFHDQSLLGAHHSVWPADMELLWHKYLLGTVVPQSIEVKGLTHFDFPCCVLVKNYGPQIHLHSLSAFGGMMKLRLMDGALPYAASYKVYEWQGIQIWRAAACLHTSWKELTLSPKRPLGDSSTSRSTDLSQSLRLARCCLDVWSTCKAQEWSLHVALANTGHTLLNMVR